MGEIKLKATAYAIEYLCDKCKNSYIEATGNVMRHVPSLGIGAVSMKEHKCPKCGALFNLKDEYPYITYDYSTDISKPEKKNGKRKNA